MEKRKRINIRIRDGRGNRSGQMGVIVKDDMLTKPTIRFEVEFKDGEKEWFNYSDLHYESEEEEVK